MARRFRGRVKPARHLPVCNLAHIAYCKGIAPEAAESGGEYWSRQSRRSWPPIGKARRGRQKPSRPAWHASRAYDDPAVFTAIAEPKAITAQLKSLEGTDPERLPLYGVPFAVKDNIDVAGLPTTCACPDFAYMATKDAVSVARLRRAGAIVVGKTNLDQFATGLVGRRSPYGTPRNPIRADLVPGGSSSGSGVAVSAGLVPFALGTDTAGSGRIPAGLTNIVGLKPSLGLVSTTGVVPACRSLDCVSVFARTVGDAFTALQAMAGADPSDPFSRDLPLGHAGGVAPKLRIGVPRGVGLRDVRRSRDRRRLRARAGAARCAWRRYRRDRDGAVLRDGAPAL